MQNLSSFFDLSKAINNTQNENQGQVYISAANAPKVIFIADLP